MIVAIHWSGYVSRRLKSGKFTTFAKPADLATWAGELYRAGYNVSLETDDGRRLPMHGPDGEVTTAAAEAILAEVGDTAWRVYRLIRACRIANKEVD